MELAIAFFASIIATMVCAAACKFNVDSEPEFDENGKPITKSDNPILMPFEIFNPLGLGIFISVLASYILSWEDLTAGKPSIFEFIIEAVVFDVIEIITFAIIFYIAYGIMSAAKANGNDEKARRNSAGWVTVVLNILLTLVALKQGI